MITNYIMNLKCPCCGGEMLLEKDIGTSIIYKCADCGLSDGRLKQIDDEKRERQK